MYRMVDGIKTEREFYAFVKMILEAEGIEGDDAFNYVSMTALDNGEDCGEEKFTVAINTIIMFWDEGKLEACARNEC